MLGHAISRRFNNLEKVATLTIPPGTLLFEGIAGPVERFTEFLRGGAPQLFLPQSSVDAIVRNFLNATIDYRALVLGCR